jgi:hypothetical protein
LKAICNIRATKQQRKPIRLIRPFRLIPQERRQLKPPKGPWYLHYASNLRARRPPAKAFEPNLKI